MRLPTPAVDELGDRLLHRRQLMAISSAGSRLWCGISSPVRKSSDGPAQSNRAGLIGAKSGRPLAKSSPSNGMPLTDRDRQVAFGRCGDDHAVDQTPHNRLSFQVRCPYFPGRPRYASGQSQRWALGVGRWALGVGRWALGVGRWALGVGRWAWALGVGRDCRPASGPRCRTLTPNSMATGSTRTQTAASHGVVRLCVSRSAQPRRRCNRVRCRGHRWARCPRLVVRIRSRW